MAEKSCGYGLGLFLVLGRVLSRFSYSKCRKKQLASPLVARASGGPAPRGLITGGKCNWGCLGISWSEEQAGDCFPLEKYPSEETYKGLLEGLWCVVGAACGLARAGKPHRYVQKMGLDQNLLNFHGAEFHSVFFFPCVLWWIWFFSPSLNQRGMCLRSDHGQVYISAAPLLVCNTGGRMPAMHSPLFQKIIPILYHTCIQQISSRCVISTQAHLSRNHCFSEVQTPDVEISCEISIRNIWIRHGLIYSLKVSQTL